MCDERERLRVEMSEGTPRTSEERKLAQIWRDLLGVQGVGVHDNFFELGGDSILSIQVVARARTAGLALTADQLFEHQTLAALAKAAAPASEVGFEEPPPQGPVSLTPIQQWFFEQQLARPEHWHQAVWLESVEPVQHELFESAVQQLSTVYDALRLRFARDPVGWRAFYSTPEDAVNVTAVDLSGLEPVARERTIAQLADEMASRTDLEYGPLVRLVIVKGADSEPDRVLITAHHLVIDPLSWGILIEDLNTAYAQLRRGQQATLPSRTTSFYAWSAALEKLAKEEGLQREREFWSRLPRSVPLLPCDEAGAFTEASACRIRVEFTVDETRLLLADVGAAYNTQVDEMLLAGLAQVLATWTGDEQSLIGVERHGREGIADGIDVSRSIGWFTSYYPALLSLDRNAEPRFVIRSVKEQLRSTPRRGIGYGVLRYLAGSSEGAYIEFVAEPQVIFNYAGRIDVTSPGRLPLCPVGPPFSSRAACNQRGHLLEINAFVSAGQLQLDWEFSADVHHRSTVERLAQSHLAAVRVLMAHCLSADAGGYTPSDFPESELDQESLDRFLDTLQP